MQAGRRDSEGMKSGRVFSVSLCLCGRSLLHRGHEPLLDGRMSPMTNHPKGVPGVFVPLFVAFMGVAALSNIATRPRFETFHAVDVVGLIGAGMCFGAAIVSLVMFFRGRRPN